MVLSLGDDVVVELDDAASAADPFFAHGGPLGQLPGRAGRERRTQPRIDPDVVIGLTQVDPGRGWPAG